MNWSDEEVSDAMNRTRGLPVGLCGETVRAIMSRAVELEAARGGTMTAEELAESRRKSGLSTYDCAEAFEHIATQGATMAVLEADAETLRATIRADRQHDALLKTEIGGTSGETLRGAAMRVKKERDDARAEIEEWRRGSLVSYDENKALQDTLRHEIEHRRRLETELDAAWKTVGVPVRGLTTLADVLAVNEADRKAIRSELAATERERDEAKALLSSGQVKTGAQCASCRKPLASASVTVGGCCSRECYAGRPSDQPCSVHEELTSVVIDSAILRRGRERVAALRKREARWREAGEIADAYAIRAQADLVEYVLTGAHPKHPDTTEPPAPPHEPSGQVAEDLEAVFGCLEGHDDRCPVLVGDTCTPTCSRFRSSTALSRLAALAKRGQDAEGKTLNVVREQSGPLPKPCVVREEGVPNPCEDGTCTHQDEPTSLPPEAPGRVVYEAGAADMRAACWEALQGYLRKNGYSPDAHPVAWDGFKAAIEGAEP